MQKGLLAERNFTRLPMPTEIPVRETRSGIPKVMGILLIVFASLYLAGSLFNAVSAFLGGSIVTALPALKNLVPELKTLQINLEAIFDQLRPLYMIQGFEKLAIAAISGFGLFAGIKLLRYTQSGLALTLLWAYAALAYLVIEVVVQILLIQPLVSKFLKTLSAQVGPHLGDEKHMFDLIAGLVDTAGVGGAIAGAIVMAVFPVLMIVLLNTRGAKNACAVET